jgi:hypothetical protein
LALEESLQSIGLFAGGVIPLLRAKAAGAGAASVAARGGG